MHLRALVIIMPLLVTSAAAADLRVAECMAQRPSNAKEYWSFRIVEDKRCWYPGRPGKSKTELRWTTVSVPSAAKRPGAGHPQLPAADLANTCCWPVLQPTEEGGDAYGARRGGHNDRPVEGARATFDQTWKDLLTDMAMPFTRWRQPLKDQQRFGE